MSYADAVAREVAWLNADLSALPVPIPTLLKPTGPFDLIKAFGRSEKARVPGRILFVSRERAPEYRLALQQKFHVHHFRLKIGWPVRATTQETDLSNLDTALELLLTRIRGPIGDKTHGGRFLSVAEGEDSGTPEIDVIWDEPELVDENNRSIVFVRYLAADLPFIA